MLVTTRTKDLLGEWFHGWFVRAENALARRQKDDAWKFLTIGLSPLGPYDIYTPETVEALGGPESEPTGRPKEIRKTKHAITWAWARIAALANQAKVAPENELALYGAHLHELIRRLNDVRAAVKRRETMHRNAKQSAVHRRVFNDEIRAVYFDLRRTTAPPIPARDVRRALNQRGATIDRDANTITIADETRSLRTLDNQVARLNQSQDKKTPPLKKPSR
jgi:hypothetical protein